MPFIYGRKRRRYCGMVGGEAGIWAPHDQSIYIYIINSVIHYLSKESMCSFYINILNSVVHSLLFQLSLIDNFTEQFYYHRRF